MDIYHISERKYPPHYLLKAETFDGDSFFYQNLSEDNKRINDFLSSLRPEGEPSRRKCIFAFARKEHCVLFGKDLIQAGKEMHLYRCVMKSPEGR